MCVTHILYVYDCSRVGFHEMLADSACTGLITNIVGLVIEVSGNILRYLSVSKLFEAYLTLISND